MSRMLYTCKLLGYESSVLADPSPGSCRGVMGGGWSWSKYQFRHERLMSVDRESLCEEIGEIVGTGDPCDDKVSLLYAVAYPMESHVDAF